MSKSDQIMYGFAIAFFFISWIFAVGAASTKGVWMSLLCFIFLALQAASWSMSWHVTHSSDSSLHKRAEKRIYARNNEPTMNSLYFDTVKYIGEGSAWAWGKFTDITDDDFGIIDYDVKDNNGNANSIKYDKYMSDKFKTKLTKYGITNCDTLNDMPFSTNMLDEADCRYAVNKKYPKAIGYNFDDSNPVDKKCRAIEPVDGEKKLRWHISGEPKSNEKYYKGTFGCAYGGYLLKYGCMAPGN
jgi:hypothetical protein